MIVCRVLENDYQRHAPLRQRGLGVVGVCEGMTSSRAPILFPGTSSAMLLLETNFHPVINHRILATTGCKLQPDPGAQK